jgi:hypothetical protein
MQCDIFNNLMSSQQEVRRDEKESETRLQNTFDYLVQHIYSDKIPNTSELNNVMFEVLNVDCSNIMCKSDWKALTPKHVHSV